MSCVWRPWDVFLEHGGGALGTFKSPNCTYNQAWTFSSSTSHYFCFLGKRSGRRMPPAERSAFYLSLTLYQYTLTTYTSIPYETENSSSRGTIHHTWYQYFVIHTPCFASSRRGTAVPRRFLAFSYTWYHVL